MFMQIKISAGDWSGLYEARSGNGAICLFFQDVLAGKIKLCQLSPLGQWLRSDGEEIPFRIAPALMAAGKISLDDVRATLRACDLHFTDQEILEMAFLDAWMLESK